MEAALIALAVVLALAAGAGLAVAWRQRQPAATDDSQIDRALSVLRAEVAELQTKALERNREQFLDLAEGRLKEQAGRGEEQLRARQEEFDKSVKRIGETLESLTGFVRSVDKARSDSILRLDAEVKQSRHATEALGATTAQLSQALAGGQTRGQWGERMADDVLRVAGFIEGINYRKNRQIAEGTTRPDFTFLLPQDRVLHMDVKFPLAGYTRYLDAQNSAEQQTAVRAFLSDVRQCIKEVAGRADYINPSNGTLDYMLVFIPNEQVFGFIHQQDATVADEALRQGVVLCSPLTLFAVLAVIHRSVESARLSEHTNEILAALGGFTDEWARFKEAMAKVERDFERTHKDFEALTSTRTRQLDRRIAGVEQMRAETGDERIGGGEAVGAALPESVGVGATPRETIDGD